MSSPPAGNPFVYVPVKKKIKLVCSLNKTIRFSLVAAFVFGPLVVPGQQLKVGEPTDSGDAVFSAETRLVPLNVTVTDKSGHLVTDLPRSAFQVFENGVQQTIRLF